MSEKSVSQDVRAEKRERLQMRTGCSLMIAAPCLIGAGTSFIFGHHDAAKLALLFAAVLVILYLILVCVIFEDDFIHSGIPCGIASVLFLLLLPVYLQAFGKARATACVSNVKYITLDILMYTQDYEAIPAHKGSSNAGWLSPPANGRQFLTCPLDPEGTISYTFNSSIADVPWDAMISADKTVLIYEGKGGKLNYRHDGGRAAVGFVNGSCKLISPKDAASLIWTVPIPKTNPKAPRGKTQVK